MLTYHQKNTFLLFLVFTCFIYSNRLNSQWIITEGEKLIQLKKAVEELNTCKICGLVEKPLQVHRIYFIEWSDKRDAEIAIITSDGKIYLTDTNKAKLRYFVFEIPFGHAKIDSFKIKLKNIQTCYVFDDIWRPFTLMGVDLSLDKNDQLVHKTKIIPCPASKPEGLFDKPIISLPLIRPKVSVLTASFGIITGSSLIWFLNEKSNAKDYYQKYQNAHSMNDAVDLRTMTLQSRTRRDIAGTFTIVSGTVFSIFLIRDLFFRESKHENISLFGLTQRLQEKQLFSLIPEITKNELSLYLSMKF